MEENNNQNSLNNMKLDEIVAWYQKKIGTYDKQEWEKTVERKILNSFTNITLKNAKLKTEFIDVDLVRGSSFPKAKPKQSLLTVIRLAILRYLFLPVYTKWWVAHTSYKLYFIFLILYIGQVLNWALYIKNTQVIDENNTENIVSISELIIPMILSFILCLIHSLIVSTNSTNNSSRKNKHVFNKSNKLREKIRRKKKIARNVVHLETTTDNNEFSNTNINDLIVNLNTNKNESSCIIKAIDVNLDEKQKLCNKIDNNDDNNVENSNITISQENVINASSFDLNIDFRENNTNSNNGDYDVQNSIDNCHNNISEDCNTNNDKNDSNITRRNVNWDLSHNNYSNINDIRHLKSLPEDNTDKNEISIDQSVLTEMETHTTKIVTDNLSKMKIKTTTMKMNEKTTVDAIIKNSSDKFSNNIISCDNSTSSSTNNVNNIISSTSSSNSISNSNDNNLKNLSEPCIHVDDGFESLNGKSSSGEDNKIDENKKYDHNEFNYNKKIEIINTNKNLKSNKNDQSSYSSSNENTPLVQSKNQLRQRFMINKNKNRMNNSNNTKDHNTNNDDDDDDGDELSNEELFKCNFDKLKKRYSIPMIRNPRRKLPSSESDFSINKRSIINLPNLCKTDTLIKQSLNITNRSNESSDIDEDDYDEEITINQTSLNRNTYSGRTTSAAEWFGITTNSEECSYSSEPNSDLKEDSDVISDHEYAPTVLLSSHGSNDIISCTMWDGHDPKKAEMSVLDISSCIIERVEAMPENSDYIYIGVVFSLILSLIPALCRLCEATVNWETSGEISYFDVPALLWEKTSFSLTILIELTFGKTIWKRTILIIGFIERLILTLLLFFILAVAERTFKQRFLYAKLFSHLTSSRRARLSDLPHFRLNKVRNIKTWLSVRSYLKRRGPQRSVDVIVSTAFGITLLLLSFLSVECLKDSVHMHSQLNLEAFFWSGALGIYLLRFMTLGNEINRKYRSISVLITEQINLYLQIEQKPKKKDELMVANSVLKLAADLLKELESPFKISGLSANPYLFTTIKVVILSAFSGVLSELLGFKLKLHKIKIK